ncbi:MAG: helix-turn-helix domain-containing protein [Caulobacteraceae bacterium]
MENQRTVRGLASLSPLERLGFKEACCQVLGERHFTIPVLVTLIERAGFVVPYSDLIERCREDCVDHQDAVQQRIARLRAALKGLGFPGIIKLSYNEGYSMATPDADRLVTAILAHVGVLEH